MLNLHVPISHLKKTRRQYFFRCNISTVAAITMEAKGEPPKTQI